MIFNRIFKKNNTFIDDIFEAIRQLSNDAIKQNIDEIDVFKVHKNVVNFYLFEYFLYIWKRKMIIEIWEKYSKEIDKKYLRYLSSFWNWKRSDHKMLYDFIKRFNESIENIKFNDEPEEQVNLALDFLNCIDSKIWTDYFNDESLGISMIEIFLVFTQVIDKTISRNVLSKNYIL